MKTVTIYTRQFAKQILHMSLQMLRFTASYPEILNKQAVNNNRKSIKE